MSDEEVIKTLQEIKEYLCAGNPVWDVKKIREAMTIAIDTMKDKKTYEYDMQIEREEMGALR